MELFNKQTSIDLQIPQSWNRCSTEQLRKISAILIEAAQRENRFLPMDMLGVKVRVFFALAGLEIVERVISDDGDGSGFLVRFRQGASRTKGLKEPFPLYDWQLHSWLNPQKNEHGRVVKHGVLDWMNADSPDKLLMFPVPLVRMRSRWRYKSFRGPQPLMNGFTWERYRYLQDYMELLYKQQNRLLQLQRRGKQVSVKELLDAANALDDTRASILAVLFTSKVTLIAQDTGCKQTGYYWSTDIFEKQKRYFRNFSDIDFQLICLWYQGQMTYLSKTYPKVFKEQSPKGKKQRKTNPLEVYTRTTATLEKYLHVTAKDVDHEPYSTILQQLNDIVTSNEEMEKIRKK